MTSKKNNSNKKADFGKDTQNIKQQDIKSGAQATNIKIDMKVDRIGKLIISPDYKPFSDSFEAKSFEDKDLLDYEKDEAVLSISDLNMIKDIIKNEEEIKEILPKIGTMKIVFDLLPKTQKGFFITALQAISKEDKIKARISEDLRIYEKKEIEKDAGKILDLIDDLAEEENFSKIFHPSVYPNYKKIYNIMRCSDLDKKILPYVRSLIDKHGENKEEIKEEFLIYWGARLSNHPYATFVSSQPHTLLEAEILNKFDNGEKEPVRVFARKPHRIIKAKAVCQKIADEKNYSLIEEEDMIGYDKATCFRFE